jgi:hypothetical protein
MQWLPPGLRILLSNDSSKSGPSGMCSVCNSPKCLRTSDFDYNDCNIGQRSSIS